MRIEFGSTPATTSRKAVTRRHRNFWALVLAGGEGSRLRQITTDASGAPVPKQFCSLTGRTLLQDAIARAHTVVAAERTCTIVSETHRQWWECLLSRQPPANVIVQPRGRGTGIGILFSALHIAARDPDARLLILPSDHHVQFENTLSTALSAALLQLKAGDGAPMLLGLPPNSVDSELGYIVPALSGGAESVRVSRFVEKPDLDAAQKIIEEEGALWNTFIIAASVRALVRLFMQRFGVVALEMQAIVNAALHAQPRGSAWPSLVEMFERIPAIDFSRDILQHMPESLRVMRIPECGWSDLGTPSRLGATLRSLQPRGKQRRSAPFVDLAVQHAQYEHRLSAGMAAQGH